MDVMIRGRRWKLLATNNLPKTIDGCCDDPRSINKSIRIRKSLKGRLELETIIHECSHAGHWDLAEEAIQEMSFDLARILYRLGYRKVAN